MSNARDRQLGMHRPITRRDFLDGAALALTGSAAYRWSGADVHAQAAATQAAPAPYPPALTGMRGTHDGAWEVAHSLRDGRTWDEGSASDTGEQYDLVVVGGGISGLAAAYFYRKAAGAGARILVLDNHDDFGGHAKRNEFTLDGRTLIGYGGTQAIENRRGWSAVATGLRDELGIDTDRFFTAVDQTLYTKLGLGQGVFFDRARWGVDRLVRGGRGNQAEGPVPPDGWWRAFSQSAPFSDRARADFVRVHEEQVDYLPGQSIDEKRATLRTISYRDFLLRHAKVNPQVADYFQQRPHSGWGIGADAAPAFAAGRTWPGLLGLGLPGGTGGGDPYIFHFPDGNASIARLIVRRLIPNVSTAGTTMDDIVTARFDYAQLDQPRSPARVRLSSTVVRVRHEGAPTAATRVVVTYVRGGRSYTVRGARCVLACYHSIIPRLCPELGDRQRTALLFGVKTPLVYTNVLLRNWRAFEKLAVSHVYTPSAYYALMFLDFPVTLGEYRPPRTPDEPMLLHLVRVPCDPGKPRRDQHRAGRANLLGTTFEQFERETRNLLARVLDGGGFDPARDIRGITVNRWPHGYADFGDPLTDPDWPEAERPWVVARQRFGRIAIANSDAAHEAETHAAIDEGHRAVQELLDAVPLIRDRLAYVQVTMSGPGPGSPSLDIVSLGEPLYEFSELPDGRGLWQQGYGGDTMNCAIAAARQGARVAYLTRLGQDAFGDQLLALWKAEGLDVSGVEIDPDAHTAVYFITHGPDGHTFTYLRAGSAASRMRPEFLPLDVIRGSRFLYTSGITQAISTSACDSALAAMRTAREAGVEVVYAANIRLRLWPALRAREVITATIPLSDVFLLSVDDAEVLCGGGAPDALLDWCHAHGATRVVLTLGRQGLVASDGAHREPIGGYDVAAVDATGAGDCLAGALMARMAAGDDYWTALRYANAAAALTTLGYGAVSPIPRPADVRRLLGGGSDPLRL